jgi:glycosyltransferase involved in cell wall biosynthesis
MKRIFYVFRTSREQMLSNYEKGLEPDNGLYGLNHLRKMGYEVNFSDIAYSPLNLLFWFFLPLQKIFIRSIATGFKIDQALLLLPKLNQSDVVISTTDSVGLPLLLFKIIGLLKTKLIYVSIGLVNEIDQKPTLFQKAVLRLLIAADIIICYSPIEKKLFSNLIPQITDKISILSFGINTSFFKSSKKENKFILSVGRDKSRDYKLLAKVAQKLPKENFVVITSSTNITGVTFSPNVKVLLDQPYIEIKKFYSQAKLVFLPLKEIRRASGQIAFLEALASDNKIVISRVKGITETYPDLINKKPVYLYQVNNLQDAAQKIRQVLKDKPSKVRLTRYNSANYSKKLKQVIEKL